MFDIADYNAQTGPLVSVVNASTGTIERFMVVASGTIVPFTTTVDVDPANGQSPLPVAPTLIAALTLHVVGVAQQQISPGKRGVARRRGMTFIRVGAQTLNMNSAAVTTTTAGAVAGSTGHMAVFYCSVTASQTINFGTTQFPFTVSHAYGYLNCEPFLV